MSTQDTAVGFSVTAAAPGWGELQLVEELRAGSAEAFDYLIALYHQPLFRFITRLLGDVDDAADVLQDTFLKVFRAASGFEAKCSLKTWVYQIALHEASNQRRWWRRHKQRETSIEAESGNGEIWAERLADRGESPLTLAVRGEQHRQLVAAMGRLPKVFQTTLVLREIEGFSYDEIAAIQQVRVGTVKSRLMRGREMLRGYMRPLATAGARVSGQAGAGAGAGAGEGGAHA